MEDRITIKYVAHDEDVLIVGGKGNGKTTKAKLLLSTILRNKPYWVFDYNHSFTGFGQVVHGVPELQYGQYILQPFDKSFTTFASFCDKAFFGAQQGKYANTTLVFDELHQYIRHKQQVIPELSNIVNTARNYGLVSIFISTTTTKVPSDILTNVKHCFAFKTAELAKVEWLTEYVGIKGWALLPEDKRFSLSQAKQNLIKSLNLPKITKHSCIYRHMDAEDSIFLHCYCTECEAERGAKENKI